MVDCYGPVVALVVANVSLAYKIITVQWMKHYYNQLSLLLLNTGRWTIIINILNVLAIDSYTKCHSCNHYH